MKHAVRPIVLSVAVGMVVLGLSAGVRPARAAEGAAGTGTLKVSIVDEAGKALPARVHLRDAEGKYVLPAGQATRQRAVYKGSKPVCGDFFYTAGSFSIDVIAGEATIDINHGFAFGTAHDVIKIEPGKTLDKTYTLKRLADPLAAGWYNADEHLHQPADSALMLGEDLNLVAHPICGGVELKYKPDQRIAQVPDAQHLVVSQVPAVEWDCFLWNLRQPVEMKLGEKPWPTEDFATSDRPGGANELRTSLIVRTPFLIEKMHAAGATTIAYMHDPPRIWWYPLYVQRGWIDVYGVLENAYCGVANRGSEADFWTSLDNPRTNGNFGVWYRFLSCGYRLPASAGTDNIGMGMGVWKGYNRVYAKVEGEFNVESFLAALKKGRTFVTNRPLLFVTVEGKEAGAELAIKSGEAISIDCRVVSATPISRIDILHQGKILKQVVPPSPSAEIRHTGKITVPHSGWVAVRCLGKSDNPNLSPAYAFAHTSPYYVIVDGKPIRSPDDARWIHDEFKNFTDRSLPRVKNEPIGKALEAMCGEALARYKAQAEGKE